MNYYKYAIIPTPKSNLGCSSCGKEIEGLPYYNQIVYLEKGGKIDNSADNYLGLGLRVPMCEDCDSATTDILRESENSHRYVVYILTIVIAVLLVELKLTGWSIATLIIIGIILLLIFGLRSINHIKSDSRDKKLKNHGIGHIKSAFDYLISHGWTDNASLSNDIQDYTENDLMQDLDEICRDGKFCILDSETGQIVDYKNPMTMKEIFSGSIWTITYESDD